MNEFRFPVLGHGRECKWHKRKERQVVNVKAIRDQPQPRFYYVVMSARYWRGWTSSRDADAYEKLLKENVLPGLKGIKGYCGGGGCCCAGEGGEGRVVVGRFVLL